MARSSMVREHFRASTTVGNGFRVAVGRFRDEHVGATPQGRGWRERRRRRSKPSGFEPSDGGERDNRACAMPTRSVRGLKNG